MNCGNYLLLVVVVVIHSGKERERKEVGTTKCPHSECVRWQ